MTRYLFFVSIYLIGFFLPKVSFTQVLKQPGFSLETDSVVSAGNGSIINLTLTLSNNTNAAFSGYIKLETIGGIDLVGKEKIPANLAPNEKIYYPLRLLVTKKVPAGQWDVNLYLRDEGNQIKARFKSKIVIAPKKLVQLINYRPIELMQQVGDSLKVSVLLSNMGNGEENIKLIAAFPNLSGGKLLMDKEVRLNAFQDTLVFFKRIISRELIGVERFTVDIAALYGNGDLINNIIVSVQNVSGNRKYIDPAQQGYMLNNFGANKISLGARNLFSENESWQFNGRGLFQLPIGSLGFSADAYQWTNSNSRPLITNTWLNYELNHKGITIGNISENLETFINGKGIKLYAGNENKRVEAAFVDKAFNLLGDEYKNPRGTGFSVYGKTFFSNQSGNVYNGTVIYDRSPNENTENIIAMNNYQFLLKKKLSIGFDLGTGLTRQLLDSLSDTFKPSIALGGNLNGNIGKYTINSSNYYSSAYYPGIKRGLVQLNERISRTFNKVNGWMAFSYYDYKPQFLNNMSGLNNYFSNSIAESGASFPLSGRVSLNLAFNKIAEKGNIGIRAMDRLSAQMDSYRFIETIGWRSKDNLHNIYLTAENGFSKSPLSGKKELQLRTNASWNYASLGVNTYFQQGNLTLVEALSNTQLNRDQIYRFSISPNFRKSFYNNKLNLQLNLMYNQDSYSGKIWMCSGNAEYSFTSKASVFVNSYFYNYRNNLIQASNAVTQAGFSYRLPDSKNTSSHKKGNIEIFCYFDNNTNGVFDEGDMPAEGRIIFIENTSFITGKEGIIRYKNVPYGDYKLNVPVQNWYAPIPALRLQNSNLKLNVPLQKAGKLKGKFQYVYDEKLSLEVIEKYAGLKLIVSGNNGYAGEVITDSQGEFTLYVPIGDYEIVIDESSLPKNVFSSNPKVPSRVEEEKTTVLPVFELKAREKKIEIKRFSQ